MKSFKTYITEMSPGRDNARAHDKFLKGEDEKNKTCSKCNGKGKYQVHLPYGGGGPDTRPKKTITCEICKGTGKRKTYNESSLNEAGPGRRNVEWENRFKTSDGRSFDNPGRAGIHQAGIEAHPTHTPSYTIAGKRGPVKVMIPGDDTRHYNGLHPEVDKHLHNYVEKMAQSKKSGTLRLTQIPSQHASAYEDLKNAILKHHGPATAKE